MGTPLIRASVSTAGYHYHYHGAYVCIAIARIFSHCLQWYLEAIHVSFSVPTTLWNTEYACTGTLPNCAVTCCALVYQYIPLSQVLTRFLCSSSPVLYWFAAVTVSQALLVPSTRVSSSHLLQGLYSTLFSQYSTPAEDSTSTFITKLTVFYFLAYVILGCVFHCNFYPWT